MTIVHVPEQQPNHPAIRTIKEYLLDPRATAQDVFIHDGWRPLCVRSIEHSLILVVEADTGRPLDHEVFRLLLPGADLDFYTKQGIELAFLGQTFDGRYLFLDVPAQPEPQPSAPARRIGRMDLT